LVFHYRARLGEADGGGSSNACGVFVDQTRREISIVFDAERRPKSGLIRSKLIPWDLPSVAPPAYSFWVLTQRVP